MKKIIIFMLLLMTPLLLHAAEATYKPKEGYVPDEATAKAIAEAVWIPIYGKDLIQSEKPFHAVLKEGVWTVNGTLHCSEGDRCRGGVSDIEILKEDGRILKAGHGK